MPAVNRRAAALDALPTAKKAAAHLKRQGHTDFAEAVTAITGWAQSQLAKETRKADRDAKLATNRSIWMEAWQADHFKEAAATGPGLKAVVEDHLEQYVAGTWTPEPPERAPRGTAGDKLRLNVRVDDALWAAAAAKADDPEQNGGRKLGVRRVALAALIDEYPLPEPADG